MFGTEFLLKGVAAPAIAALLATLFLMRVSTGRRGVAAYGLIAGQAMGTALAVWGPDWFPNRNSEWVPWATVAAAVIGPMVVSSGLAQLERWLLAGLTSLAAAALIVPTWPDLWPSRAISIPGLAAMMLVVARGVEGLSRRSPPRLMAMAMSLTAVVAAMLIAATLSLKLGESALVTAASLAGASLALLIRPSEEAARGVALPYAVGVLGWCYVGAIELPPPSPPLVALIFIPLAPLALWAVSVGPVSRMSLRMRCVVGSLLVVGYLAAVGGWTWSSGAPAGDDYVQA